MRKIPLILILLLALTLVFDACSGYAVESNVYMTRNISPEGLVKVYEVLGREAKGNVAIKIHMGEPGNKNFISPKLIGKLVQRVNGTIVDCNTAYGGLRASTAMHLQVARDHGFMDIAPVDIMDAEGSIRLSVEKGRHLRELFIGSHYRKYDFFIILSHFKGHILAGFGGAIKNMAVGMASVEGKVLIHTAGKSSRLRDLTFGTPQRAFLESVAEAAKAIADDLGENVVYINIMNNLSVDCDCFPNAEEPDMHDIGILGSLDPVALDRACVDLVYSAPDGRSLVRRIESRDGKYLLEYAEKIGLGSQKYKLIKIDD
ncbi:MAG: DUF362 domain-containing protein [Synergistetes bacterium]|nr:MAG: hypothetical protein XD52_0478 [bacterium 42_11]MBC7330840.1 DUF362 domain-containing protein [Synergistota bacterium]